MDNDAKLRPFYLLRILYEETDENHYLSTVQLCDALNNRYGMEPYRKTVKSDIELLRNVGFEIVEIKSTQNKYALLGRKFSVPELKLLIDAVESSKLITEKKTAELIGKLASLSGKNDAAELKQNLLVNRRYKAKNEQIYYIIDTVNRAIDGKKKISFQMAEYNIKKQRVLHNRGENYVFSPYSLVWDGDYYYVVGYSDKYNKVSSHRVDRIFQTPTILDEAAVKPPKGFNLNKHVNTMFGMYSTQREEITLLCDNDMMDKVIDKFGTDVQVRTHTATEFNATVTVAPSPVFFAWVFTFGGKIRIAAPEEVKQDYLQMLQAAISAE